MARPVSTEKAGEAPAPCCGRLVMYRKSAGGHLKFRCDHCDLSGYSEQGGAHFTKTMQHISGPGSVKEPPPPAEKPSVKKPFSIGDL